MFYCYAHGWNHIERLCPMCHSFDTTTSGGANQTIGTVVGSTQCHSCNTLREENERLAQDLLNLKTNLGLIQHENERLNRLAKSWEDGEEEWRQTSIRVAEKLARSDARRLALRDALEKIKNYGHSGDSSNRHTAIEALDADSESE